MSEKEKTAFTEDGLVAVLDKLLDYRKQNGEKNTLIMLALLNLLEIVRGMSKEEGQGNSPTGNMPFNPAALMNLLGGVQGRGQGFDLSSLMGLLGNFLGGMPAGGMMQQPPRKDTGSQGPPVGKAAGKMKVEKNVYKPENKAEPKGNTSVKTLESQKKDIQVNGQTSSGEKGRQVKKPDPIKWEFGKEKKY